MKVQEARRAWRRSAAGSTMHENESTMGVPSPPGGIKSNQDLLPGVHRAVCDGRPARLGAGWAASGAPAA